MPHSDAARRHTLSSGWLVRGWLFIDRPCAWRKHLWWFQPRDINMCLQAPGWWACLWNHERQLVFHLGPPRPYQPHSDQFWQPTNQLSGAISQQPRGSWRTLGGSGSLPEARVEGLQYLHPSRMHVKLTFSTSRQLNYSFEKSADFIRERVQASGHVSCSIDITAQIQYSDIYIYIYLFFKQTILI